MTELPEFGLGYPGTDLRRVPDAADRAARIASDARSATIAAEHVSQALRDLSG